MPADGTQIKQDIDNNLGNKGYRGVRVFNIITALKAVVDWVTGAVNGNLSTWLRISDSQPGGTNGEGVYRTGKVLFTGGLDTRTKTPNGNPLAQLSFDELSGLQIIGNNGGPAFMQFSQPNVRIDQLGVDIDGVLKYRSWATNVSNPIVLDGFTSAFKLASILANRKITLFESANNDHQFLGFGVSPNQLRYQVDSVSTSHVFYSGSSPVTSTEIMRIGGSGNVGINQVNPVARLDIVHGLNQHGLKVTNSTSNNETWLGYSDGKNYLRGTSIFGDLDNADLVGIGSGIPTSKLHVKAATGHQQFRLETPYTPTGSGDSNGQPGQMAWDNNYFYLKGPAGVGWRRAALQSF